MKTMLVWMKKENISPLLYYTRRQAQKLSSQISKENRELQEKDDQEKKEIEEATHQLNKELEDRIKKVEKDPEKAFGKSSVRRNKSWISEKLKK